MNVKVMKKTDNEIRIEIEGSGHGLCNLIQKKLLEDKTVDFAGYDVPHPLASSPLIYVRMKGKAKPEDALIKALNKVLEANQAFSDELERVLKV